MRVRVKQGVVGRVGAGYNKEGRYNKEGEGRYIKRGGGRVTMTVSSRKGGRVGRGGSSKGSFDGWRREGK